MGRNFINYSGEHHAFHQEKAIDLKAGEKCKVEVFYRNYAGDADIKLLWSRPRTGLIEKAVLQQRKPTSWFWSLDYPSVWKEEENVYKDRGFQRG